MLMTEGDKETMKNKNSDEDSEKEKRIRQREEEICDLFYLFDRDRSGTISLDELAKVMVQFGGLSKEEIDVMLLQADLDGDGKVIHIYLCTSIHTLLYYSMVARYLATTY
jgi:Ca2+-binding EF-hand superfamily protein